MKKTISLFIVMTLTLSILLTGCFKLRDDGPETDEFGWEIGETFEVPDKTTGETKEEKTTAEGETETTKAHIENEKPVYPYTMDYDGNYHADRGILVHEWTEEWSIWEDLLIFEVYNTDEEEIYFDNQRYEHYNRWIEDETEKTYKIGYEISFLVDGENEKRVITILGPSDIKDSEELYMGDYPENLNSVEIPGYFGCWVYDDIVNRDKSFYIHLSPEEVDEDTLMTSIKLRPTSHSDEISDLRMVIFSYSSDEEFDEDGHYCGDYGYEVKITNG